jgi:SulP family sulfate permease
MAGGIALSMKSAPGQAVFATVLTAIAVTSLIMATILLIMGRFKAGGFVRYIPYPVVGGFLAGTGSLLAQGGLSLMMDIPLSFANLPRLLIPERLNGLAAGSDLQVALYVVLRRTNTSSLRRLRSPDDRLFWDLLATGIRARLLPSLLLGPFPSGTFYQPLRLQLLQQ